MRAKAKVWLKHDNRWIAPGEEFEVTEEQAADIAKYADLTGEPDEPKPEPKPRAPRKKK